MLHALVLAAEAFPIRHWPEDAGAKQAIALRLERAVIDGLRLGYFTVRPAADFFRRGQADTDGIKVGQLVAKIKRARTVQGFLLNCACFCALLPTAGACSRFG